MWTITQLKERGRHCFKRNFWRTVLVALVVSVIGGTQGGNAIRAIGTFAVNLIGTPLRVSLKTSVDSGSDSSNQNYGSDTYANPYDSRSFSFGGDDDYFEFFGDDDVFEDRDDFNNFGGFDPYGGWSSAPQDRSSSTSDLFSGMLDQNAAAIGIIMAIFSLIILLAIIMLIVSVLFDVFFRNPLFVGTQRFFIHNLKEPGMAADMGFGFDRQYKNQVKVMFFRDLYTFAWTLLCFFPGIYKSYEYRMIPYLLAEYPHMSKEQAFYTSKYLMKGDKWRTFVLDLSFIGWWILSGITLGVVGIFYVNPYYNSTCAALYEALKTIKGIPEYGRPTYGAPASPEFVQQQGFGAGNAQAGFGAGSPQAGYGQDAGQFGYGSDMPQPAFGDNTTQPGQGVPSPEGEYMQEEPYQTDYSEGASQEESAAEESYAETEAEEAVSGIDSETPDTDFGHKEMQEDIFEEEKIDAEETAE